MADQATPDEEDDDFEIELEGVDPEILEHARKRADRQVQETQARAEILETYDTPSEADTLTLDDFKGFRFTTRHLLIATAVLAVAMLLGPDNASLILGLIAVIGLAIQVMGFELPGIIVFGWWILLVLYVLMSAWAIIGSMGGP